MIKNKLTSEQETFVCDNYRTMNNIEIGKIIDRHPKGVLRVMKRLGLSRTSAEKQAIITKALSTVNTKLRAQKTVKIEGGSRNCYRKKYHLAKWVKINGRIRNGKMLVYNTGDFDNFEDLVVIRRSKFATFVRTRNRKKHADLVKVEKELKKSQKRCNSKTKIRPTLGAIKRKKAEESAREKFEEFKKNYKPKTIAQAQAQLSDEGKVPVKIDRKTTVWVSRDKCDKLDNGTWVKKQTSLNENNYGNKNERFDTGTAKGAERRSHQASKSEDEIYIGERQERTKMGGTTEDGGLANFQEA